MNVILKVIKLYKTPPLHGDNLSTLQERAPKNQWSNVKYKSDVLKTNKDVAFQSYKISLTFVEQNRGRGKHYSGTLF